MKTKQYEESANNISVLEESKSLRCENCGRELYTYSNQKYFQIYCDDCDYLTDNLPRPDRR